MEWLTKWINPQDEPTYYAITILIDGPVSERIDKVYKKPIEITPEFLASEAEKELARIEAELTPPVVVEEII
jgi:hypothetical protein